MGPFRDRWAAKSNLLPVIKFYKNTVMPGHVLLSVASLSYKVSFECLATKNCMAHKA